MSLTVTLTIKHSWYICFCLDSAAITSFKKLCFECWIFLGIFTESILGVRKCEEYNSIIEWKLYEIKQSCILSSRNNCISTANFIRDIISDIYNELKVFQNSQKAFVLAMLPLPCPFASQDIYTPMESSPSF